jgi:ankyrin repeat protein
MRMNMTKRCQYLLLPSRRDWLLQLGGAAIILGVGKRSMSKSSSSLIDAVYDRDQRRVRELIASGANLEERKSDRSTPLLLAAETDQFEIADALIDAGADIWATSEFGDSVGWATEKSKLVRGADADARHRVLTKLRAQGFPFPAQYRSTLLRQIQAGEWPPKAAAAK